MKRSSGVTLVELVIAISVISIAVAGLMAAYSNMVGRSADPLVQQQSLAIAEAFMEEVSSKPFLDPSGAVCPSPSGGRTTYNNVCDYDGFTIASSSVITDLAGASLSLSGYGVSIDVTPTTALGSLASTDALEIEVTVSNPIGLDIVLISYRTRY